MPLSIRLVMLAACACLAPASALPGDVPEKLTFVIVHGATAGGWEWKKVATVLEAQGHTVYRPTLTGLGERYHLANADIDLDTHIEDVVNVILFEELDDVILAGHSYGGMVITGVMNRIPERIRHVEFLDAAVPDDGESMYDLVGGRNPDFKVVDGLVRFPWYDPDAPFPKGMPHPEKTFSQAVSYDNPAAQTLPVTYIAFVAADQSVEERRKDTPWRRAVARGWTVRIYPGWHVVHQDEPEGVAAIMVEAAGDTNSAAQGKPP